jgi:hypothetical protein
MKRTGSILVLLLAGSLLAPSTSPQSPPPAQAHELRSVVRLLPGYTAQDHDYIDTGGESIWKKGGFRFGYTWDMYAGTVDNIVGKEKVQWRGEQIINGQKAIFVYTKSNRLIVAFPEDAGYFRGIARRKQDLAEMLLMIATYGHEGGYAATPGSTILPRPPRK